MTANEWNRAHPVGTSVVYTPIKGRPEVKHSTTRSKAWTLGHGAVIVKIEGLAGGVGIDHLEPDGIGIGGELNPEHTLVLVRDTLAGKSRTYEIVGAGRPGAHCVATDPDGKTLILPVESDVVQPGKRLVP